MVRISVLEENLDLGCNLQFGAQDAKIKSLNGLVNVCFFSLFGAKRNYTSPNSSESAKDLVRISVLEENLDLGCTLLFGAQDAKSKSLNILVNFCFSSLFGAKRNYTSPTSSDSANDLVRISVLEEKLVLWWNLQFGAQDAKIESLNILVNVCFASLFGAKRNYTSPTGSESAKDLARKSVLEEKLDFCWNLQFGAQDAKIESLNILVNVCFASLFGAKRNYTSPTSSESAKDLARKSVLEEKLDFCWKLQFGAQDAKIESLNILVNVCFASLLGAKRKHNCINNSESAKDLVRISVLEEKLGFWGKLQFGAQDAKV